MKPDDLEKDLSREALLTTVALSNELQLTAKALQAAIQSDVSYPIDSPKIIFGLFEGDSIELLGHHITFQGIERYISDLLPIDSMEALAQAIYIALNRCNSDLAWAMDAPGHAEQLLKEVSVLKSRVLTDGANIQSSMEN